MTMPAKNVIVGRFFRPQFENVQPGLGPKNYSDGLHPWAVGSQ